MVITLEYRVLSGEKVRKNLLGCVEIHPKFTPFTSNSPHSPQIHPKIHPLDYEQTEDMFVHVGLYDAMRRIYLFEVGGWWGLSVHSLLITALV